MEHQLKRHGEVSVVAPATEQSGVGHSVTFLTPLVGKEVFEGESQRGWAVDGSPADCVKLGVFEYCRQRPDLIISGINSGLNAGINVLYSGTVAAAIEGAFFGITSVAVSLEEDPHADHDKAARLAWRIIDQILSQKESGTKLYNLNIPSRALKEKGGVRVVPMGVARYGEDFERRVDPLGRTYFWATKDPPPQMGEILTDLSALHQGNITLTPLDFDLTKHAQLEVMRKWQFNL